MDHEGMIFVPLFAYVNFACTIEITVPWSELQPFLSDEGRTGLAALRAD
jgi:hypothetical protein